LGERRDAIRTRLAGLGWTWIDDPANADAGHPRIAARQAIAGQGVAPAPPDLAATADLARSARFDGEAIRLSRADLVAAASPARRRVIAMAAVCAGGGERLPRGERLDRLTARLADGCRFIATLAGATVLAGEDEAVFTRNAGEAARGGLAALTLPGVWDGRYALDGQGEARPLGGLARRLSPGERRRLASVPAQARPSLPVVIQNDAVSCPLLADAPTVSVEALVPGRFLTACGVYAHERELERWAR
jgi:tRNA(Ile)-lysidine synthase